MLTFTQTSFTLILLTTVKLFLTICGYINVFYIYKINILNKTILRLKMS